MEKVQVRPPSRSQLIELDRAFVELKAGLDYEGGERLSKDFDIVHALATGQIDVEAVRSKFMYIFLVDYTLTVAQLLKAGRYDCPKDDVNDTNFPITGSGTIMQSGVLVYCRYTTDEKITAEFQRRKLRDATNQELLAFGIKFPYFIYGKTCVIQRGSVSVDSMGRRCDSCLCAFNVGVPRVYLHHIDHDWSGINYILAFPLVSET